MNLLRCLTCNKILTSEEVKNHNFCDIAIKNHRTLFASCLATFTNNNDENCVMFMGLDGISYDVIEKKPDLVEYTPDLNADPPQGNTNKNNLRGNRTK